MRKETEIDIAAAEVVGSKYDEACKKLFQNKEIIAPVLKEVEYEIRFRDAAYAEDFLKA